MTAPTVPVTVRLADFGGSSEAGIVVTARMSDVDYMADGTFVANGPVEGTTDADGLVTLNLFPNAAMPSGLGTRGTTVRVRATLPNSRRLSVIAVIPNEPCSLASCVVNQEPTGLDLSQQAASDAQAARNLAKRWATQTASEVEAGQGFGAKKYAIDAAADALQTAQDRQQTGLDRIATGQDRVQTDLDRQATAADVVQTAGNRGAAETAEAGAEAARVAAEAARDSANTSARAYPAAQGTAPALADGTISTGQTFAVVAADLQSYTVYRKDAGPVATSMYVQYTKGHFDALQDTENYGASGYSYAVVDASGNIAIGVKPSGAVSIGDQDDVASAVPGGKLATTHFEGRPDGSGYAFAVADSTGNGLPFAVLSDGRVWVYGSEPALQPQVTSLSDLAVGTKQVFCWGDSLTEGSGATGGNTYPAQLGALIGGSAVIVNEGFGGQQAAQISARQGGNAVMVTVSGNSIPASGAVSVTIDVSLLAYPSASTLSIKGYLAGVLGTLTKDVSNNYTFTRDVNGSAVVVPPATPFVVTQSTRNTAALNADQAINLFWMGSNDVGTGTMSTVLTQIEKCIFKLTPNKKRFLILGPIANAVYTSATAQYIDMRANSDAIKAKYPRNFIDLHQLLVYNYNPGLPQDVIDFGNGVTPTSLRAAGDNIHLNNTGYGIVAAAVKSVLDSKGWLL